MNERIKQLSDQAKKSVPHGLGVDKWIEFYNEKFAELIVNECAATIANDTANYPGEGMMAYYQGVQDSARAIKKHFGVEK
jgi:hypothetical protein